MTPEPIKDILSRFDNLLNTVYDIIKNEKNYTEVESKLDLIRLWREELESEKQSIYIVGKTSTGKSEFHNFLLETKDKKTKVFKTSTKVETGIIQTLEHCANVEDSRVEIVVKDKDELSKLNFPSYLGLYFHGSSLIIPLNTSENIAFLRDNLISKKENKSDFDVMKAIERVNVRYPLKYLKRFRLIDTPGLSSSISTTDKNVRELFQGKSFIFWFVDGSKRTLSESLALLVEEKELIINNINRISVIINKFDLMEYENDFKSKDEVFKRKQELIDSIYYEIGKILNIKEVKVNIFFTSFKWPRKKLPEKSTYQVFKVIDESLVQFEKESFYNNIESLNFHLLELLFSIKESLNNNLNGIEKKIKKFNFKKKELIRFKKICYGISNQTLKIITKEKIKVATIKKEKNLNTHNRYNSYLKKVNVQIINSCRTIKNSVFRIDNLNIQPFINKLKLIEIVKKNFLKEEETLFKKYVNDPELRKCKVDLEMYVNQKIADFDLLIPFLNKNIYEHFKHKSMECDLNLKKEDSKRIFVVNQLNLIAETEMKINNVNTCLLNDIESRVAQWNPKNIEDKLENFLSLYSLLQQHHIIEQKNIQND